MEVVKRIEIIIDAREMREICRMLEKLGIEGYSVVREVTGRGDRGVQSGDELTGACTNSLLLTTCAPERVTEVVEAIRPILRQRGGVCLISDALWVRH